jgi:DNA-3-methyladenine glycosylase
MARRLVLPRAFYARPTLDVARDLVGKVLVHDTPEGPTSGVIVEAEAYIGEEDPACHASVGPTPRNRPLYGPPGHAYVYFNYGMHYLVNAVTEDEGRPAAVLLRALAPLEGLPLMRMRRLRPRRGVPAVPADPELCRGPGNLTCALGISLAENELDLTASRLRIEDRGVDPGRLAWSPRVGIRFGTEQWWRVFVAGHPAVSGPRGLNACGLPAPRTVPWRDRPPRRNGGTARQLRSHRGGRNAGDAD